MVLPNKPNVRVNSLKKHQREHPIAAAATYLFIGTLAIANASFARAKR